MSSYTVTVLAVSCLLVLGIRPGIWGLLRLILLVHIVGDLIFAPVWMIIPTYAWMRYVSDADRQRAAVFLALAVCLTELGYRGIGWVLRLARYQLATARSRLEQAVPGLSVRHAGPMVFTASFFVAGLLLKLAFLGATGVLTGERSLGDLRPNDSVGLGAIVLLSDFLIPYGLAALRATRRSARVEIDLFILAGISYFSFSKSAFITYVAVYGLAYLLAFGRRETRRQFISWRLLVVVLVAFLTLGIKTQQRSGAAVDLSSSVLADQALVGASARFMGGIFRAYSVTYREIRAGWPPLGGSYHGQAIALAVPRFLWPEKPRVASEQLYYLLGVTEEAYGTAFAVNSYGAMLFDFGVAGTLVGSVVLGLLLRVGDEAVPAWRDLKSAPKRGAAWHYLVTAWLYMAIPLSEGGLPIAIVNYVMLAVCFIPIDWASRTSYRVLAAASLPASPLESVPHHAD